MTRYEVALLPDAEAEIREAFLWYAQRSPIAADAFRTDVFEAIDSLVLNASIWPQDEERIHSYVLRHFPYTIYYELDGLVVTVLAVAHQRRLPRYWQKQ
jgi:plasmid stabilization system protein ParE